MTDHKAWIWKKKSTEKTLLAADKINLTLKVTEEEKLLTDRANLERDLKSLTEKLSSALSDCNTKDDLVTKHEKTAKEAIAGWEKAEVKVESLKQDLDKALQQRTSTQERLTHLDTALKECMQQLRFVREEQEKRIHDAVAKTTNEFEKTRTVLEDKLAEANKKLSQFDIDNIHLAKALLSKEKSIQDLNEQRTQAEADFNALMAKLESTEKTNASLNYELRLLVRELEIRTEEKEFNRRTADATHKQHLESSKKIAKLESECQRLRVLVRKRLPGPAALAKMKNEVEVLGRNPSEMRRRSSPGNMGSMVDFSVDHSPNKKINYLMDQLLVIEEENKMLKEALNKKTNELEFSTTAYARAASKLSQVEAQLEESPKSHKVNETSLALASCFSNDDKVSCDESWASALISDMNLMDDFAEMEKLAIVSVDKLSGSSHTSSDECKAIVGPIETNPSGFSSEVGKEIVPVPDYQSRFSVSDHESPLKGTLVRQLPNWLEDIVKVVVEQSHISRRNPEEILEDIRVAIPRKSLDSRDSSSNVDANLNQVCGYITWKPNLSKSISKMIELIEDIRLSSMDEMPVGYVVRVFQWKTAELSSVLQQFVCTCNDVLNEKADLEKFAGEVASTLSWIMKHCLSLLDGSRTMDAIKKHFDGDESRSRSEISQFSEANSIDGRAEEVRKGTDESKSLMIQLHTELENSEEVEGFIDGPTKNSVKRNLDSQLAVAMVELDEARQKFSSLEVEVEKENDGEESEATSLEQQSQPESVTKKETPNGELDEEEMPLRADWEIAASQKLAECQETILNLGKQFKALASPKGAALFDKAITSPTDTTTTTTTATTTTPKKTFSRRGSLLDQMLADDSPEPPRTVVDIKKINNQILPNLLYGAHLDSAISTNETVDSLEKILGLNGKKTLAIVPTKRGGNGGLFRKLMWRRKKGNSKKRPLHFAA